MYMILMDALCLDCHSPTLLNKEGNIEVVVENMVALILLDFFGEGIVIDVVKVICVPATLSQSSQHLLQVQATSLNETDEMAVGLVEARLEEAISYALLEHFHVVVINTIDVHYERNDAPPAKA